MKGKSHYHLNPVARDVREESLPVYDLWDFMVFCLRRFNVKAGWRVKLARHSSYEPSMILNRLNMRFWFVKIISSLLSSILDWPWNEEEKRVKGKKCLNHTQTWGAGISLVRAFIEYIIMERIEKGIKDSRVEIKLMKGLRRLDQFSSICIQPEVIAKWRDLIRIFNALAIELCRKVQTSRGNKFGDELDFPLSHMSKSSWMNSINALRGVKLTRIRSLRDYFTFPFAIFRVFLLCD